LPVVFRFAGSVIIKGPQAAVSAAIGVQHQQHLLRAMEPDGFTNLLKNKLPVGFQIVSSQTLGAPGNHDGIKELHANTFGELVQYHVKTMVKTPDDGCIGLIAFSW